MDCEGLKNTEILRKKECIYIIFQMWYNVIEL